MAVFLGMAVMLWVIITPALALALALGMGMGVGAVPLDPGAQKAVGGEEGHLRVIGDQAQSAVGRLVVGHAYGTEVQQDVGGRHEFDGRPQGIAHGATEQAAGVAGQRLLGRLGSLPCVRVCLRRPGAVRLAPSLVLRMLRGVPLLGVRGRLPLSRRRLRVLMLPGNA